MSVGYPTKRVKPVPDDDHFRGTQWWPEPRIKDDSVRTNERPSRRGSRFWLFAIREVHIGTIIKSHLLLVVLLQVTLLGPTSAADGGSDECGLASVYSSVSEETASGEDTLAENFTAAHRSLPFGTLVHVNDQKMGATRWCGSPIVVRSLGEE